MKQQKCKKCGKTLEAEVTWHYELLQVMWYCDDCKCGLVRDVYFTGTGAPSFFEDANMRIPTLEGCPTDEEIQIAENALLIDAFEGWGEGRGYGYFPKEGL